MAYEMQMGEDGILRMAFAGDIEREEMEAFREEFMPFLETATEEEPLLVLSDSREGGKFSSMARKIFLDLNRHPHIGKAAVVGANRYTRVLASLVIRATGRDNIHFFGSEAEALVWLKAEG